MYTTSNIIIQSSVNSLGTDTVAAWAAYGKIDVIFWMIISAFSISVTTFVGQNYGAGKMDRVRKGIRVCLGMSFVTTLFLSLFLYNFGQYIFQILPLIRQYSLRYGRAPLPGSNFFHLYHH